MVDYYVNSDIYVQPSLSETLPSTVREAMAVGRPVIGTKAGFIPEIIANGKTGFLAPKANARTLADAIIKLLGNEKLRLKMGFNARKYAENNFDWGRIEEKWYGV